MLRQESLDRYVARVIKEKGLTLAEVRRRAGGEISTAYICEISHGSLTSLTIKKLQALARGLGVLEDEIFAVARGAAPPNNDEFYESRFAALFAEYQQLAEADKKVVRVLLEAVEREIEWRRHHPQAGEPELNATIIAEAREHELTLAEADWKRDCCC
jgi:transcriptional regulator with XRE-family HTH domain